MVAARARALHVRNGTRLVPELSAPSSAQCWALCANEVSPLLFVAHAAVVFAAAQETDTLELTEENIEKVLDEVSARWVRETRALVGVSEQPLNAMLCDACRCAPT